VVFNPESDLWGNPLLRQALSLTADRAGLAGQLPPAYTVTEFVVPPVNTLAYRPYRGSVRSLPVPFDPEQGRRLLEMGVLSLGIDGALSDAIHVPDKPGNLLAVNALQQGWQKNLPAYISVESEPLDEVYRRLAEKDYSMVFFPVSAPMPEAVSFFSAFLGRGGSFGYANPLFEAAVKGISGAVSMEEAASSATRAESLLLHDAVVIPVFTEQTVFVISPGISGLNAAAFPSELRFWHAKR